MTEPLLIDRNSQQILDALNELVLDPAYPEVIRAERTLIPEPDGREHWRVDLWLTRVAR